MPRKSSADIGFPTRTAIRIAPPDDLTGDARTLFVEFVIASRADFFQASDAPLLAVYCRALVQEKAAAAGLVADGYTDSDWLPVLQAATRSVTTLSRMLKLNPAGRHGAPSPGSEPVTISAYERLALEAHRDGRN